MYDVIKNIPHTDFLYRINKDRKCQYYRLSITRRMMDHHKNKTLSGKKTIEKKNVSTEFDKADVFRLISGG